MRRLIRFLPVISAFFFGSVLTAWVFAAPHEPTVDMLVDTDETILGQAFEYPDGRSKITAAIVTVPPHAELKPHLHPVPVFGYILQGELVVDYGSQGERRYRKGDAFVEAFDTEHRGRNGGKGNVEILALYAGADGVPNTIPVEP